MRTTPRGNTIHHIFAQFIPDIWRYLQYTDNTHKAWKGRAHLIVDAYDEPHLLEFYQRNGLNLFFSSLEQEMQYRNWEQACLHSAES